MKNTLMHSANILLIFLITQTVPLLSNECRDYLEPYYVAEGFSSVTLTQDGISFTYKYQNSLVTEITYALGDTSLSIFFENDPVAMTLKMQDSTFKVEEVIYYNSSLKIDSMVSITEYNLDETTSQFDTVVTYYEESEDFKAQTEFDSQGNLWSADTIFYTSEGRWEKHAYGDMGDSFIDFYYCKADPGQCACYEDSLYIQPIETYFHSEGKLDSVVIIDSDNSATLLTWVAETAPVIPLSSVNSPVGKNVLYPLNVLGRRAAGQGRYLRINP